MRYPEEADSDTESRPGNTKGQWGKRKSYYFIGSF